MHQLITIGDPVIDTHVQIPEGQAFIQPDTKDDPLLCFPFGKKIPIQNSFQALGGNAANVAVGAARLGVSSALLSTLGGDTGAGMVKTLLEKEGVATDYLTSDPKSITRYSVVLNYAAERTILSYSDAKEYQWPDNVGGTDWIYYTGLGSGFEVMQKHLLAYLQTHQTARLAVNPGSYMLQHGLAALKEVLPETDLLILNLEEAEVITGHTLEEEKSVSALMHGLFMLGPEEVVITDGERGAWAGNFEELWHMKPYPVKVVAKTGAGDAFSSGYLSARQNNHDVSHALQWGIANSSGVIQQHGAQTGLFDRKQLENMMARHAAVQPELLQ